MKMTRRSMQLLLVAAAYQTAATVSALPEIIMQSKGPAGTGGGVASEATECSTIGRDLLARGGNAVDAIVGTTFCVGVVGMYHSGIGGGGFALVRDENGNYEAVDFREAAPAAAFQDMYKDQIHQSIVGGLAAGVPSEVRGLEYMHQKYGVLPWKTVMRGAVHVARNGFKVSKDLVKQMNKKTYLVDEPAWAQDFAPNGILVKEGEILTRKRYANTLERIANGGSAAFYKGQIATDLIDFIRENNGTMTMKDLDDYQVVSRPVHSVDYRGLKVHGIGSPAGGAVALYILKLMEQYDTADWHKDANLTSHRFAEAMRFAYAARGHLGDPSYVEKDDVIELEEHLLSQKNIEAIQHLILDDRTQHPSKYSNDSIVPPASHGTSHIVAADKSGIVVSLTTTINLIFGAEIIEPKSGIIINNEMNDFSIPGVNNEFGFAPSEANFIRPFKRPLSSMTPLIAEYPDGTFFATVGAGGGSRIISASAQTLWHAVEHDMTMAEALEFPRLHDQLIPNVLTLEREFPYPHATEAELKKKGHEVKFVWIGQSAVQGIKRWEDGSFEAVGEPRQNNSAGFTI